MPDPKVVAGVAWFRPEQWHLLRSLAADADELEETFSEWEAIAEKAIRDLAGEGVRARKVDVDVHALQQWCLAQKRPLDGSARAAYAASRLHDENQPKV
jgi:hypothetical protein